MGNVTSESKLQWSEFNENLWIALDGSMLYMRMDVTRNVYDTHPKDANGSPITSIVKSHMKASTHGNVAVPGTNVIASINVYEPAVAKEPKENKISRIVSVEIRISTIIPLH